MLGTNAQKVAGSVCLMIAGDVNANGQVQNTDFVLIWKPEVGTAGYRTADFNLNGQVQNSDLIDCWKVNVGKGAQVPQ